MNNEKVKEIKKALECCAIHDCCDSCIFSEKHPFACLTELHKQLLTYINELENENEIKTDTITDLLKKQELYETEKLKQFAERLKEKAYDSFGDKVIWYNDIGETLKEFINEKLLK